MRRLLLAALLLPLGAAAQDLDALRQSTLRLIEQQVRSGVLTRKQADEMIQQLRPAAPPPAMPTLAAPAPEAAAASRDALKAELREELRRELRRELQAQSSAPARDQELAIQTLSLATQHLIDALVRTGILTGERAEELMREARLKAGKAAGAPSAAAPAASEAAAQPRVVRVPYVPQHVRDEIRDELREEILAQAKNERWAAPSAIPEWTTRLELGGDLRLRHQSVLQPRENAPYASVQETNTTGTPAFLNTTDNVHDQRLRLRLSLDLKVADRVSAGVVIASGSATNPVSTNQALGRGFNKSALLLDRAWLRYAPASGLSFTGGRVANPWFATELIWDEDLSFEGLVVDYRRPFTPRSAGFATLGAFPLDKGDCSLFSQLASCKRDKWLYGAQLGLEQSLGASTRGRFGLAYYQYRNVSGELVTDPAVDPRAYVPRFAQKGNTLFNVDTFGGPYLGLAADFKVLALTGRLDFAGAPTPLAVYGELAKNIGYDADRIRSRTGGAGFFGPGGIALDDQRERTTAFTFGGAAGPRVLERARDWQLFGSYRYLQRDAVLDAYTDSDFHLGGTDAKGWVLGAGYAVARNSWLRLRWLTANAIDGPPLAIDVLQLDFNARF